MTRRVKTVAAKSDAALIVEFCVRGPAVTAQVKGPEGKRRRDDWKAKVAKEARAAMPANTPPRSDEIEVFLLEFSEFASIDRDNMAKPILDAMQGIVYVNDRQAKAHRLEWCDLNGSYRVRHMSPAVAKAMVDGFEFVWIRVFLHRPRMELS